MKEAEAADIKISQRFSRDDTEYINNISDIIERDMMRYDHTISAEEETNEY